MLFGCSSRKRLQQACLFEVEGLERRVLLSSALAIFGPQQTFAAGSQPRSITAADLNLDGKVDLVIANGVSNNVSVLLGNGNGTFQSQVTYATGLNPLAATVADVNGDGKPDIIVANNASNTVSVLLGNGNGTFQPQYTLATGSGPRAVVAFDVNGDGKADLLVANYSSNTVSTLLGNGNGTFQHQFTTITGYQPRSIAIIPRFRFASTVGLVVVNHGDNTFGAYAWGNGIFQNVWTDSVGKSPWSVAVGDFNGDGTSDLVVANGDSNTLSVLLGHYDGTFSSSMSVAVGTGPISVTTADVNGDGNADLIVANYNDNNVGVLLGNGNGTFQAQKTFATGVWPRSVAVADVNGDGAPDLLVANAKSNTVSVLEGDVAPTVLSINRTTPPGPFDSNTSVTYTVTFSKPVSGVDPTDFSLALTGSAAATTPVAVSGSGAVYTVTVNGISGTGTLGLNLVNDGTIKDPAGNPVQSSTTVVGPTYRIVPLADTINGTAGNDSMAIIRDLDGTHIDWTMGTSAGQLAINDPNGLTVNGNGGTDTITVDYTNANPLPNILHLNGTIQFANMQGTNPLAGTTLEIGRSTVLIYYQGFDPLAAIQGYLGNGYNSGAWNGMPTGATGVITSDAARANPNHNTAIGYRDIDNGGAQNAVELIYTLSGDANLDGSVNTIDLQRLLLNFNSPGSWSEGDFNYDGVVNTTDLQTLLFNFNTTLVSQATAMAIAATPAAATTAANHSRNTAASSPVPAIQATGSTRPAASVHPTKLAARKRR
jgi:hypothetical protein